MAIQILNTQITLDLYDYDKTPAKIKTIQLDSQTRYVDAIIQREGVTYDIGENAGFGGWFLSESIAEEEHHAEKKRKQLACHEARSP